MPGENKTSNSYVLIWLLCGILIHYVYTRLRRGNILTLPAGVLLGVHQQYRKSSDGSEHGRRIIYGSNHTSYKLSLADLQTVVSKYTLPAFAQPMQIPENLEWHNS